MEKNQKTSISFLTILGTIFVILKLANQITWSWCYVLLPFWFPFAIVFGMTFLVAVGMLVIAFINKYI